MFNNSEDYFIPYQNYFWEWEYVNGVKENSAMVVIKDGPAIVYWDVLKSIINDLDGDSFPPFGALLLLIYASRPQTTKAELAEIRTIFHELRSEKTGIRSGFVTFDAAMKLLQLIADLPSDIKTDVNRKVLITSLLKQCVGALGAAAYTEVRTNCIDNQLINRIKLLEKGKAEVPKHVFYQDIRVLSVISTKYSTQEQLLDILITPVKPEVEPEVEEEVLIDPELKDVYRLPNFVNLLEEREELFKTGALIKYLWSGINLPQKNEQLSDQPMGGIADLTNKGELDRVLLSELAYPNEVFMSRFVNNEVLYLDREAPSVKTIQTSIYLVDVSLTAWGIPKVVELALFFSFISKKNASKKNKLILVGDETEEVPFSTIQDIISIHNTIDGSLDCSMGLGLFLEEYTPDENTEVIVLTSEEGYEIGGLNEAILEFREKVDLLITTSRFGHVNLWAFSSLDKYLVQQLKVPVQQLWDKPRPERKEVNSQIINGEVMNFPLLFPWFTSKNTTCKIKDTYYLVYDKSIWVWSQKGKGVEMVLDYIPNKVQAQWTTIALNANGHPCFITYDKDRHALLLFSFKNKQVKDIPLEIDVNPRKLWCDNGTLVVQDYSNNCYSIDRTHRLVKSDISGVHIGTQINKEINEFYSEVKRNRECQYNVLKQVDGLEMKLENEYTGTPVIYLGSKYKMFIGESVYISAFTLSRGHVTDKSVFALEAYGDFYVKRVDNNIQEVLDSIHSYKPDVTIDQLGSKMEPLQILKNVRLIELKHAKEKLEGKGAVCYFKINRYKTLDGSEIEFYKGLLKFTSSNAALDSFYISSVIDCDLGMATEKHFAGNEYFYNESQEQIERKEFYHTYIVPFFETIKDYGN